MLNLGTGHFSSPVCLLCVEGEGEKGIGFFSGRGGDSMVFEGDPGEINRQRQNLKKGL